MKASASVAALPRQPNASADFMAAPGEATKHGAGFSKCAGFAQRFTIQIDQGICAEGEMLGA